MAHAAGGCLPERIKDYGPVRPFTGAFDHLGVATRAAVRLHSVRPGLAKVLPSLKTAIEACGLRDGSTISFHHHLRDGDGVLNAVLAEIARMGLCDIKVAASSLSPCMRRWWSTSAVVS
jgi:citrate lyase subunit alpha / citrate CoA-transferase